MINCKGENTMENKITIRYYSSWSGYQTPPQYEGLLSKEEALTHKAYYIVYYDNNENIISDEKYLDGKLYCHGDYKYNEYGRLIEEDGVNYESGQKIKIIYDEMGKMINREVIMDMTEIKWFQE